MEKKTLAEAIENLSTKRTVTDSDVKICIQNYLHYIKSLENNPFEFEQVFRDEPSVHSNVPEYVYSYAAALVESISLQKAANIPEWVNKFSLKEPWFPKETQKFEKLKKVLMRVSPDPFKKRNLFVSKNALDVI